MKIVTFPGPVVVSVKVRIPDGGIQAQEIKRTFLDFLTEAFDAYAAFKKGPKAARQYDKIMTLVECKQMELELEKEPTPSIAFEDEDFNVIREAVDHAEWITPSVNRKYIPFYDAMDKVETYDPKAKKDEPKKA